MEMSREKLFCDCEAVAFGAVLDMILSICPDGLRESGA